METVTAIILRKTPYRERDLIISAVSADCGKLELIAHGASSIGEKKFPVLDIFRELAIDYEPGTGELGKFKDAEIVTAFDALAGNLALYRFAGKLAAFVAKNSAPALPMPLTYDAFRHALDQLARRAAGDAATTWQPAAAGCVLKLALLSENGLLPDFSEPRTAAFIDAAIDAGVNGEPLPECAPEYWTKLGTYLNSVITAQQLQLP